MKTVSRVDGANSTNTSRSHEKQKQILLRITSPLLKDQRRPLRSTSPVIRKRRRAYSLIQFSRSKSDIKVDASAECLLHLTRLEIPSAIEFPFSEQGTGSSHRFGDSTQAHRTKRVEASGTEWKRGIESVSLISSIRAIGCTEWRSSRVYLIVTFMNL